MSLKEEVYAKLFVAAIMDPRLSQQHGTELAQHAQSVALAQLPYALLPGGSAQSVPGLPELLSTDPTAGASGVNPLLMMTKGWPQQELIACVNAVQTIVMGREYGRTVDQLSQEHSELIAAIEGLYHARLEAKGKKS
jgi:hypothetical protein